MSFQVGSACYASVVDAGGATCSQFVPKSFVDSSGVYSIFCVDADAVTGALNIQKAFTPSGGATVYSTVQQLPAFPPCSHGDYLIAAEQVFASLLALFAVSYGMWHMIRFLGWSRGAHE